MLSVSSGTGFFTKIGTITFLVTNWHVLTNRDPNNPSKTLSRGDSPTHIRLHLPRRSDANHFIPMDFFPLYHSDGSPTWLEHQEGFGFCDIALLPGGFPEDAIIPLVEEFAPVKGTILEPAIDVCLVGFPFGRSATNPFPIWKKAMIASEPNYAIDGKPYIYLDMPGRPGMSGSPVYKIVDSFLVSQSEYDALESANSGQGSALEAIMKLDAHELSDPKNQTRGLEFVGIYSGSLGDQSLDRLNLGRFWSNAVLEAVKKSPQLGSNPVPPVFF